MRFESGRGSQPRRVGAPRTSLAALLAWLVIGLLAAPAAPASDQRQPQLDAATWSLVDLDDGTVLASEGAEQERSMASTTKLMTAYVARRQLELGQEVAAAPYAASPLESLLGLTEGERIEVRDLLFGLLLVSGNDAAQTLAVASSGSEPAFEEEMNAAAAELGLEHTSYANPIGLDEAGNYTSAADLVTLSTAILDDPFLGKVVATRMATLRSGARIRRIRNSNVLLQRNPWVDGVKTGYTSQAGYVLVASGEQRDAHLLSVVMGAPTEAARDAESLELLDYGFSLYERRTPVEAGDSLATTSVAFQNETLALEARGAVELTARDDESVEVRLDAPESVEGPVERGEELGAAVVRLGGEPVGRVALVAARPVEEASLLERVDARVPGERVVVWAALALALVALLGLTTLLARGRARG